MIATKHLLAFPATDVQPDTVRRGNVHARRRRIVATAANVSATVDAGDDGVVEVTVGVTRTVAIRSYPGAAKANPENARRS